MRYVGLDVHYGSSTYCVLEANGQEVQCETIRGHWPKLLDWLKVIEGPWRICFEATCGYGYLYRELSRLPAKAEHLEQGPNTRFLVTNLAGGHPLQDLFARILDRLRVLPVRSPASG